MTRVLVLATVFFMVLPSLAAKRVQKISCSKDGYTLNLYYYTGVISGRITGSKKFDFSSVFHNGKLFRTSDPSWIPGYTGACMFGVTYRAINKTSGVLNFRCWRKIGKSVISGNADGSVNLRGRMLIETNGKGHLTAIKGHKVDFSIYHGKQLKHWSKGLSCKMVDKFN